MNANNSERPDQLGRELGIILPPGARIAGVRRESGIDAVIAAKVELPTEDARAMLEASAIDQASMRPGPRGFLGPDRDWWDPAQAPGLRTGQVGLDGGRFLSIGISERGPAAVLYVVNHGT